MKKTIFLNQPTNHRLVMSLSSKDETSCSVIGGSLSQKISSSHSGIYALLIVMMSMFLFSCEDQPVSLEDDQITQQENNGLSKMTKADKLKYFGVSDLSQLEPGYTYTWMDTLNAEDRTQTQPKISLRSSYTCGINVEMYFSGTGDTAKVTVYEANTMTVVHGPVLMTTGDNFDMTISGAKDYDFKVEPLKNPINSMYGNLIVDPDWGGKTIYYLSGSGPYLFEDFHFECPEPTDGTCDAYVSVYQYSGSASTYTLRVDPDVGPTFKVSGITGNPNDEKSFTIDEDRTYKFEITAVGGGSSESFGVQIIRPDQIAHNKSFYGVDMTVPDPYVLVFDQFDYFDCPYD